MLVTQNIKEKLRIAELLYQLISHKYRRLRTDKDEPDWITVNGAHVPLDKDKKAVGGHFKGQKFSSAKSTSHKQGTESFAPQKQSQGSKYLQTATVKDLSEAKASGRIKMCLNKSRLGDKNKHRKGTKAYNSAVARGDYVSVLLASDSEIDALINTKSGSGDIYIDPSTGHIKETIDCAKIIGEYAATTGALYKTTRLTVHHSKNGYHAVPASSKGKKNRPNNKSKKGT